ncbi:glutathione peroxidase [Rhodococcus sp. Leaf7]|uniref:glutathione peroxidase n=1 Tax=unclassified Rhodococcus (in: high G+C Gram-positive bacteria) TaxID=192944 RepID=UPI0005ACCE80|nr:MULTISPECIES: glutathione peroxidase [unclassified Rhodococcus (in: high G+C Gram-positive bacteria)]KIQ15949.1 glutathione peroxidase [Rhodococcus sp. MEB064]KQU06760.1 glutathione peroxidase [Rhodococcus sp. Leaf7]KQU42279.1 glutathione peroxidase [Rhodococcus sp. Leaf247]
MTQTSAYDFTATTIDGEPVDLADYKGKPLLIVNTASQCGFTPQYEGLEVLNKTYAPKGLVILGFPCDQFGHQEPGDAEEIKNFCSLRYDVTFPLHEKIEVNGDGAHPLYKWLREQKSGMLGSRIKWNFTKFLVDADGQVVDRFGPTTKPEKLAKPIEKVLGGS